MAAASEELTFTAVLSGVLGTGDANGDQKTDLADVYEILEAVTRNEKLSCEHRADVTGDGRVDFADVEYLLRKVE